MNRLAIWFFLLALFLGAWAQSPDGYVVMGHSGSYTYWPPGVLDYDFLVYKLDLDGRKMWRRNFGGYYFEFGKCIRQTPDGGYVMTGSTESWTHGGTGTDVDFVVFKLSIDGRKQWRKNLGGTGYETAYAIDASQDGDLFVCGGSDSYSHGAEDILIYRLDADGNKRWRKNLGGEGMDIGYDCQKTGDGGCIVVGDTRSFTHGVDDVDIIVYKLDAGGAKQWRRNLGGLGDDQGRGVWHTSDGGFIVAGITDSFTQGAKDFLVYKLDAQGRKEWRRSLGGVLADSAYAIQQTRDGGFIVAGLSYTYTHGLEDMLVYKMDANGQKQWRKYYGGAFYDTANSVHQTADDGFILVGSSTSYTHGSYDFLAYKLAANGQKQWRKNYGGAYDDMARSVRQSFATASIIAGVD